MKVLIIRLSAMGDTIHCLPVAAKLKGCVPPVEVHWLVEPASAALLHHNPAVDRVLVLPKKKWLQALLRPWLWPSTLREMIAWFGNLRRQRYDAVIDFQGLLKSALCAWASGCRYRLGFAQSREGAQHLLTYKLDVGDYFFSGRHIVDMNLALVDYLLGNPPAGIALKPPSEASVEFPLPPTARESAQRISKLLSEHTDKSTVPLAVLIPGTTWDTKIWPADKWVQLGRRLQSESGFTLVIVGGAAEQQRNADITRQIQEFCGKDSVADLTAKTSLLDLLAVYERSRLIIGGDSGPLHLAAASKKPQVVGIFGSTPVIRNGPYGHKCSTVSLDLWCQPCFSRHCPLSTVACLRDLSADDVYREALKGLPPT